MEKTKEQIFADHITNEINSFSFKQKKFNEAMSKEHRTLQQNFTRMCLGWIEHLAEMDERHSDARNESSLKISKLLLKYFKECSPEEVKEFKPSAYLGHV